MYKKTLKLIILILILSIVFLKTTTTYATSNKTIKIYTEELPPYQFKENGILKGSSYKNVARILECTNLKGDFIFLPWNRALYYATHHKNTLLFSMARTLDREKKFVWLEEVGIGDVYIYKLKSRNDIHVNDISDIKKYRMGLLKDDFVTNFLINNNLIAKDNNVFYQTRAQKFKMFLAGRFDLIDQVEQVYSYKKSEHMISKNLEKMIPLNLKRKLYLVTNKKSDRGFIKRLKKCAKHL